MLESKLCQEICMLAWPSGCLLVRCCGPIILFYFSMRGGCSWISIAYSETIEKEQRNKKQSTSGEISGLRLAPGGFMVYHDISRYLVIPFLLHFLWGFP